MLRPTINRHVLILAVSTLLLASGAGPAFGADNEVTVTGGGWGHGIGMPQYGAKALAESGSSAQQILQHFYTGAAIGTVGQGGLTGHAAPLRIGVGQKMSRFDFRALDGPLNLPGGLVAQPNQAWSLQVVAANTCQFFLDNVGQGTAGPCDGQITWANQPGTKVLVTTLGRTYARGKLVFDLVPNNSGAFHLLVEIDLEQYLYGLGEMPSSWHPQALQAQAIAGRTYALFRAWTYRNLEANPARMNACACHLYASTQDQSYIGWAKEAEGSGAWGEVWRSAVDATSGKALVHDSSDSRAIQAYYFSSSGGATENNEDQWGSPAHPYLRSRSDPGPTSWTVTVPQSSFLTALGFDSILSVSIPARNVSGSPKSIVVQGSAGGSPLTKTFTGNQFRTAFGLRSHYIHDIVGLVPFIPGADRPVLHDAGTGKWGYYNAAGSLVEIYFGNPGDHGFMGDWDCDGIDTPGLYRRSDGYVYLRNSNSQGIADVAFFFGNPGDLPLAGDFDGDGCDTVSIYRPSEGRFYIMDHLGSGDAGLGAAEYAYYYGDPGDAPFMGDWDGDGIDTPGLRRDSNGFVYLRHSNSQGTADVEYFYGDAGDVVFTGDWDADGDDTLGLYRPSNGTVYLRNTNTTGIADASFGVGSGMQVSGGDF
jgi:SpoIID/LytB domain protein